MSLLKNIKELKTGRSRQVKVDGHSWPSDNVDDVDSSYVSKCVRLMDSAPEKSRAGSERIHISTLIGKDWCPRAHLINSQYSQQHFENVLPQMRIVWALGRAAEHHVRTQFIKAHGKHRVVGNWRCYCGATSIEGAGSESAGCTSCGKEVDAYNELVLHDPETEIIGSPDIVFVMPDGSYEVVEIKSIKKDGFVLLKAPNFDHVMQCFGYVEFLRRTTGKTVNGRILYVAKDFVAPRESPYKEYPIKSYEKQAMQIFADLRQGVVSMKANKDQNTLPERLALCSSPASKRAKGCVACTLCFSL